MSVKDTGPGIPEEEIPVVLASFGQGSNSIKSAEQGAGLGLPIAKNLIDLHGGTFALKSKLRIGTEVIVTFPPERVMAALAPIADACPAAAAADGCLILLVVGSRSKPRAQGPVQHVGLTPCRFLRWNANSRRFAVVQRVHPESRFRLRKPGAENICLRRCGLYGDRNSRREYRGDADVAWTALQEG